MKFPSTTYTVTDFEFDTGAGNITDAIAVFAYDTEYFPADRQTGAYRDRIEVTSFEPFSLHIGGLKLDRYTVERMDKTELERIEAAWSHDLQEKYDNGEFLEAAE